MATQTMRAPSYLPPPPPIVSCPTPACVPRTRQRIPDLVMHVYSMLKDAPPAEDGEQRTQALVQLKRKMREFKTNLGEEPKMKEGVRLSPA